MIRISREEAIKVMENNLKVLKECSDSDTFLLLSFDLERNKSLGRKRVDSTRGKKIVDNSKTFILDNDIDKDAISVLSMYTVLQHDIYNIIPSGIKHDVILVPKLE